MPWHSLRICLLGVQQQTSPGFRAIHKNRWLLCLWGGSRFEFDPNYQADWRFVDDYDPNRSLA